MKNRTRESCTSGSVRDEDGNILIYSARPPVYVASPCAAGIRNPSQKRKVTALDAICCMEPTLVDVFKRVV